MNEVPLIVIRYDYSKGDELPYCQAKRAFASRQDFITHDTSYFTQSNRGCVFLREDGSYLSVWDVMQEYKKADSSKLCSKADLHHMFLMGRFSDHWKKDFYGSTFLHLMGLSRPDRKLKHSGKTYQPDDVRMYDMTLLGDSELAAHVYDVILCTAKLSGSVQAASIMLSDKEIDKVCVDACELGKYVRKLLNFLPE